jgi:hypothetical protein
MHSPRQLKIKKIIIDKEKLEELQKQGRRMKESKKSIELI